MAGGAGGYAKRDEVLAELAAGTYPQLRLCRGKGGTWQQSNPQTNQGFSALLFAFADDKSFVDSHDVLAAAKELNWQEAAKTPETDNVHYLNKRLGSAHRAEDSAIRIDLRESGKLIRELYFPIGRIVIGRSEKSDIRLPSRYISLQHTEIVCSENECIIRDLNSTNGVLVKGDQIKEYRLKSKDVLTLAGYELVFTNLREESPNDRNDQPKERGDTSVNKILP